jgi:hypothetical protein
MKVVDTAPPKTEAFAHQAQSRGVFIGYALPKQGLSLCPPRSKI